MKDKAKKPAARREDREEAERQLDEALEESFPASDPLPTTRTSAGGPEHGAREKSRGRAKTGRER
jgi:hypothetical protein